MFLFRVGLKLLGLLLSCLNEMFHRVYRLFYQSLVNQSAYALRLIALLVCWSPLQLYPLQCDGFEVVECLVEKVISIVEGY